jgi:hypothetical protein
MADDAPLTDMFPEDDADPFALFSVIMDELDRGEQLRAVALMCACRAVPTGDPVGHFLSSARAFHHFLLTGMSKTGSQRWGVEFGVNDVAVRVDGNFGKADLAALEAAITEALS